MPRPDPEADRRTTLLIAAAAFAAMLVVPPLFRFRVDLPSFHPLAVLAGVPALFLPYARWRGLLRLRAGLETTALAFVSAVPTLIFTYASMRAGAPLADTRLAAWDAAIGFDWLACVRWVDRSATLSAALGVAYGSFAFQLLCLPALLAAVGLPERAYRLVGACLLLGAASSVIGAALPAEAAYVRYGLDPASLTHLNGHFGRFFLTAFETARGPDPFTLRLGDAAGILTFPSCHAAGAALCAWAVWPSRRLRAAFAPLNLLMAASAVPSGGHYLVDVVAGVALAAIIAVLVERLGRVEDRTEAGAASAGPVGGWSWAR